MKKVKNKALVLLLLAVFFKQLAWATFIPLWQTPDEQAHFAQVSNLAETGRDFLPPPNLSQEIFLSEQILGTQRDEFGNNKFTYHPEFNSEYSLEKEKLIADLPKQSRTEFVKNEATGYPPLYYQMAALVSKLFTNGSLFDRVFAVRIFSSLTLVALTWIAYKIGNFTLAALIGFQPMLSFAHAGVTSDALFNLVFGVFLLVCLRLLQTGLNLKDLFFLGLICFIGTLTKPQANIMVFIALPLILFLFMKIPSRRKWYLGIGGLLVILLAAKDIFWRLSVGAALFPETDGGLVYPNVTIVEHLVFTLKHTYLEVLPWYWGVFRWLSLGLPEVLRKITNWLTLLSIIGFIVHVVRNRISKKEFFLVFSLVVYFVAITAFDYGFRRSHNFSFGIQGRYFFPVIIPFMVVFLTGLKPLGKFLAVGMIVLNILVFFWVTGSYYSLDWPTFFISASQYKPLWLKYPMNLIILVGYLICSLSLLLSITRKKLLKAS